MTEAPDVVILATKWQPRALIRAQLIEEGQNVVATDSWTMMRRHLRPGSKPRRVIVDLAGLPHPEEVLAGLRVLMQPDRVLVLMAGGTIPAAEVERLGFRTLPRPFTIKDVVVAVVSRARDPMVSGPPSRGGEPTGG